jgi:hypothetical protein
MIDLNDENDPLLFACSIPAGRIIVQFHEVVAALEAKCQGKEPSTEDLVAVLKEVSRTPDVASMATDAQLIAVWTRIAKAAQSAGNA